MSNYVVRKLDDEYAAKKFGQFGVFLKPQSPNRAETLIRTFHDQNTALEEAKYYDELDERELRKLAR